MDKSIAFLTGLTTIVVLSVAAFFFTMTVKSESSVWHTSFNNCPPSASVAYVGASENGDIVYRGTNGCIQMWRK